jgi:hypothetical protein
MGHDASCNGDAPACNTRLPFFERVDAFCGAFLFQAWRTYRHGAVTPLRERQRENVDKTKQTDPFLLTTENDGVKFWFPKELTSTGETTLTGSAHKSWGSGGPKRAGYLEAGHLPHIYVRWGGYCPLFVD